MKQRIDWATRFIVDRVWAVPIIFGIFTALWWMLGGGNVNPPFTGHPPDELGTLTFILIVGYLGCLMYVGALNVYEEFSRHNRTQLTQQSRLRLVENMPLEYITPQQVQGERNIEVRNALIRRLGTGKYMEMVKAMPGAKDDFGVIYEYIVGNRVFKAVKVLNSTPEPDGSFREYWLRVPHNNARQPERFCVVCGSNIATNLISPKQAIAWTFRLCEPHYNPAVMS